MNWKQARHIEEGKYLIWNPTASPLVTFVCALMLVRSVLPLLHRAAGATKESNLAGSTGMNHFISQSREPSLRWKANTAGFVFSQGNVSIVSHFASNSIKNSYCSLDAALKEKPPGRTRGQREGRRAHCQKNVLAGQRSLSVVAPARIFTKNHRARSRFTHAWNNIGWDLGFFSGPPGLFVEEVLKSNNDIFPLSQIKESISACECWNAK